MNSFWIGFAAGVPSGAILLMAGFAVWLHVSDWMCRRAARKVVDAERDIREAIASLERCLEMMAEDKEQMR